MSYHQINLRNKMKLPKVVVNLLRGAAHGFCVRCGPTITLHPIKVKAEHAYLYFV